MSRRRKPKPIHKCVYDAMIAQGVSQLQLEKATGIDQPSLSRFLTGKRGLRQNNIQRIFNALNLVAVDASELPEQ